LTIKEEIPHWHCNKRWTDVNKTKEALAILRSKDFEGKTWSEGKQSYYAIQLNKRGLSGSTNPRSIRAILGTFKFFGFAWTMNRKLLITQAGKEFINGKSLDILRLQLLKWQYPNPFEAKGGVAPYTKTLRLFPFRVLLSFLCDIGPIHEDELALYVWKIQNGSKEEIKRAEAGILAYRRLSLEKRRQQCMTDALYITNHEYEAHLRPYILTTGLCQFDSKQRLLKIHEESRKEVKKILSEKVEAKTEWKDETEWFEYYGNTRYSHPPREISLRLKPKSGVASSLYIRVTQNNRESYGLSDEDGVATFSLFEDQEFNVEVMRPNDGRTVFKSSLQIGPRDSHIEVLIQEKLPFVAESIDTLLEKMRLLLTRGLDDEIRERLKMRARFTEEAADKKTLRYLRGGRFEQLIYKLINSLKPKVFDDIIWHGKIGKWGLPVPAQKISEQTGKKLPDILAFQNNNMYVIETTLLRGRAQWEKPEAVSVPDHIESMIAAFKGKKVCGLFIAEKLDPSVETNLVTRAINKGYKIVPMEANEFFEMIKLLSKNPVKHFWSSYFDQLWNVHKRAATRKES